jgi:hypothetical protein
MHNDSNDEKVVTWKKEERRLGSEVISQDDSLFLSYWKSSVDEVQLTKRKKNERKKWRISDGDRQQRDNKESLLLSEMDIHIHHLG